MNDLWAILLAFGYVGGVVAVGEVGYRMGLPRPIARKVVHVGAGLWIIGTLLVFENRFLAAVPPALSAAANWVVHRRRLLGAVEADADNLGTVWFAVSFALLVLLAWEEPAAMLGGVLAMTLGDAAASTVGLRLGRRPYATLGGRTKSLEGSLAMFAVTLSTLLVVLRLFAPDLAAPAVAGLALLGAVAASCAEALGIKGLDNLWVPLGTGFVVWSGLNLVTPLLPALGLGSLLASLIGLAAWRKGALTPSGVLGAILTGTAVFGLGGWPGGLALVAFFVSGSLLSRLFRQRKAVVEADFAKTGTRDLGQALANGGVAAVAAVAYTATGQAGWMGAILGSLAAAAADTWATELGVLARSAPRLITTFKPVPPGTSGAVSVGGTLAAVGGGLFIALVGALADPRWWRLLPWVTLAGLAGSFLDSLLGATLQGVYWCPQCGKETERPVHGCGSRTRLHRGLQVVSNDLVNLLATVVGGLVGLLMV
ncbi:DUF92 domain-containing protein [Symbiobacterium thermophilum]|uniref:DUF92 domain-containing protein n=1 Tax=Symbiobacterium thermophilum TaxID=2734 RepID=A0A953LFD5_SYMTR|nr:DUF92 domain-containing protein [Symbiobacterium thermophilum]MBY6275123.1 DUF92 domain-containing protein [Symbiobacterium thermophilum]